MIAIHLPSEVAARAVSRGLWLIARPEAVNGPKDTQFLAAWEVQKDGTALLILDPETPLPIHERVAAQMADPNDKDGSQGQMAALLGPLLIDAAKGLVAVGGMIAKGGVLRVGDLLPLLHPEIVADYVLPVRAAP